MDNYIGADVHYQVCVKKELGSHYKWVRMAEFPTREQARAFMLGQKKHDGTRAYRIVELG